LEELQRDMKIMIAGPGNLAAFLNSLQMGFRSLAIEQRSAEVWSVLGQVKTEFGKFGDLLDRVHKQLSTASNTIQQAGVRTRAIEKKLRNVESLPSGEARDEELPELM
jgi:DNA recombination protein RmuC